MAKSVWSSINISCPNPNKSDLSSINWLEHVWNNKSWYSKVFHNPPRKVITIDRQRESKK